MGARIIYEVQENLHKKMHLKRINNGYLLAKIFRYFDTLARRHFYLILTEHGYLKTYTDLAKPCAIIYNYPLLSFLEPFRSPYRPNAGQPSFFHIGLLSLGRAFDTLVGGLSQLKAGFPDFVVHLFGQQLLTDAELKRLPAYGAVRGNLRFYGYTRQRRAFGYAMGATAGLALLKAVGDYPDSYTTKMFEYMALGLPVVTSNFALYRNVIERHRCGLCVSPTDPAQVAAALRYLIEHPDEAHQMGRRGRKAVEQHYNWSSEARKLLAFYELVLTENR